MKTVNTKLQLLCPSKVHSQYIFLTRYCNAGWAGWAQRGLETCSSYCGIVCDYTPLSAAPGLPGRVKMGGAVTRFIIGVPGLNLLRACNYLRFSKFLNYFQHKITYRQGVPHPQPRILGNISWNTP